MGAVAMARLRVPDRRTDSRYRSPVMRDRAMKRRLAMLDVPLQDLKGAARAAGGTVNDAFMAAVTGGLRRYHERNGAAVDLCASSCLSICGPRTTHAGAT